jgi:biotin transport system substrate-specific component
MSIINVVNSRQNIINKTIANILGLLLICTCSQIYIPIEPVNITLQTVAVMLIALLYDLPDASKIYFSYIGLAVMGVPVFSGYSSGIHTLFGTSGGYIFGFFAAICLIDKIKSKIGCNTFIPILVNCIAGTIVIMLCGLAWLLVFFDIKTSIKVGLLPFIIPGIIKAIVLSGILRLVKILR